LRSVSARLVERFIFNFRLSPSALAEKLPVTWLRPQVINGWSVLSFCILKIHELTLRPVPSAFGLETICCAYRCGVIDTFGSSGSPSVYIVGRNTDRPFISLMAPLIFESPMPYIHATMNRKLGQLQISVRLEDGRQLFSATVLSAKSDRKLHSNVFGSLGEFIDFIKEGVSSYARSTTAGQYSRIDLHKQDAGYESMEADVQFSKIDYDWDKAGLEYDSVVRAGGGGRYVWTFKGRVPANLEIKQAELTA
jgi:Uncharacterized conserved protein (COG2071)